MPPSSTSPPSHLLSKISEHGSLYVFAYPTAPKSKLKHITGFNTLLAQNGLQAIYLDAATKCENRTSTRVQETAEILDVGL